MNYKKLETKNPNICCEYKIFNKADCKKYLGRGQVLSKGYQPIQIKLTNNSDNVILLPLFEGNPNRDIAINEYNSLLKSSYFYNLLPFEHLLIVQTDTYLRRKIDETIFN